MEDKVTTTYLGRYSREEANAIAAELEEAQIVWWYKQPGFLSWVWEWGVRLFVDEARLDEAREIVGRASLDPSAKDPE